MELKREKEDAFFFPTSYKDLKYYNNHKYVGL